MPVLATLDLSPGSALAKMGTLPSVSTLVTSLSTRTGGNLFLNDYKLLAMLQGTPLHTPPGPCLTRAITCVLTKMQPAAKWKAAKDIKVKEAAEKKLAAAAKKADKQQRLIVNAKARATKAAAKAEDLCLKLARPIALQKGCVADPPHHLMCSTCIKRARIWWARHQLFQRQLPCCSSLLSTSQSSRTNK
jgi:hypothetical protein